ncbi:MAG: LptF/LptG family permease [candidate division Zixibacteria bacterium]|nr:LptF/LptG family permease [candidate division Zixibacteria bacterium]
MTRIDRYLTGRFLFGLFWSLTAFWVISVVVDLVEHLDKFIDKSVPLKYIALYYVYYSPYVVILVAPIGMLLATLFAVGLLAKRNEFLAMRAAGLSLWRLSFPFLTMGLVMTGAVFGMGQTIYPKCELRRNDLKDHFIRGTIQPAQMLVQNLYVAGSGGRVYFMKSFNTKQHLGTGVTVETFRTGRLVESVEMARLTYRDSVWVGENGGRRSFASGGDSVTHYETFQTMLFSDWPETPDDLVRRDIDPQEMTYAQLAEEVRRIRTTGGDPSAEATELSLKIAFPFINFIVVLIGFPIAARTRQSGMALNFGIAMMITFVIRILYEVFRSLGHDGEVQPWLAAWAPNLICLALGIVALLKVRK